MAPWCVAGQRRSSLETATSTRLAYHTERSWRSGDNQIGTSARPWINPKGQINPCYGFVFPRIKAELWILSIYDRWVLPVLSLSCKSCLSIINGSGESWCAKFAYIFHHRSRQKIDQPAHGVYTSSEVNSGSIGNTSFLFWNIIERNSGQKSFKARQILRSERRNIRRC